MDTIHTIMPSHLPLILLSMMIMNVRQGTLAAVRREQLRRSRMPQQRPFLDNHALYLFYLVKRELLHAALYTSFSKTYGTLVGLNEARVNSDHVGATGANVG
jgi:hypothetical protein